MNNVNWLFICTIGGHTEHEGDEGAADMSANTALCNLPSGLIQLVTG